MPAGKLELYRVIPGEEKLRGQAGPPEDSRHLTPEPAPAPGPVPSVPTGTQVSLGEGWGLPADDHLARGFDSPIWRGQHLVRPGPSSVATLVSWLGVGPGERGSPYVPPRVVKTR